MSYCPNCGRWISDEMQGCPACQGKEVSPEAESKKEEIKVETVEEFTVEDKEETIQRFESEPQTRGTQYQKQPSIEPVIHPALKVLVIVLIVLVGGIGAIAGCVAGAVLMKSPLEDYRSFGKVILIVSVVMLLLSFLCCCISVLLSGQCMMLLD